MEKKSLKEEGQTERWTNEMKLSVAYRYFVDNLKSSLNM
jgi:hypothetical protein